MARIVPSLQLARTEDYCYTLHLHFHRSIENFSAYTIICAALFSGASPVERLRSASSLAITIGYLDRLCGPPMGKLVDFSNEKNWGGGGLVAL